MPNRKAVAEKLNIDPHMPDDIIFKRIAVAFQLASQEIDDYSKEKLVSVLFEVIRIQCKETELQRNICVNLEKQNSLLDERAKKAEDECAELHSTCNHKNNGYDGSNEECADRKVYPEVCEWRQTEKNLTSSKLKESIIDCLLTEWNRQYHPLF